MQGLDLNNPPTPVGGIPEGVVPALGRLDLNNPPTPVGGILGFKSLVCCRLDLNTLPTPVGGTLRGSAMPEVDNNPAANYP